MNDITVGQAGLYAALGYATVFLGLILLMTLVIILGKCFTRKTAPQPAAAVPTATPAPVPAPGSAGQLKLYNVEPKTAAMIMAIVADKMGKPINELRFLSIKEVDQ